MSSSDIGAVSGGSRTPETVLVWDLAVRVFHWALAASILAAYLTSDGLGKVHRLAGYTAVGLLVFRIVWGFAGTKHARFADFVRAPATVLGYIRDILRGDAPRSLGHNPAGGAMILALLAVVAGIGTTGLMMESTRFFGSDWVETVHKSLVYSLFVLIPLHVLGVIHASRSHRENLALSMVTGRKPIQGTAGEDEALRRELDTRLRATNGLTLAAIFAMLVVVGWPQVRAQLDVLEKRREVAEAATKKTQTKPVLEATVSAVETTAATATASAPAAAGTPSAKAKALTPRASLTPVGDGELALAVETSVSPAAALPDTPVQANPGPALAAMTQHTLGEIASGAQPRPAFEAAMLTPDVAATAAKEPRSSTSRRMTSHKARSDAAPTTSRSSASRKTSKSVARAQEPRRPARRAPASAKVTATSTRTPTQLAAKRHPAPKVSAALQSKKPGKGVGRGRSGSSGKGRGGSSGHGSANSGHGSGNSGKGSGGGGSSGSGGGHGSSGGGGGS
ncbi:MAG: cytochrome b/b6 domain-containing protein [Hyphomicrobiaceae bacterium]